MNRTSILFCFVAIGAVLLSASVFSAEMGHRGKLQPFNAKTLKDASVCKYADEIQLTSQAGLSPLFGNVKNIYVFGHNVRSKEIRHLPSFNEEDVGTLAGCTLNKLINNQQINTPIYVEHKDYSRPKDFLQDGNLVIDIEVSVQKGISTTEKIVLVEVGYFRADVNDYDSIKLDRHCTKAFNYRENSQEMQKLLSNSIHACLGKVYFNKAM